MKFHQLNDAEQAFYDDVLDRHAQKIKRKKDVTGVGVGLKTKTPRLAAGTGFRKKSKECQPMSSPASSLKINCWESWIGMNAENISQRFVAESKFIIATFVVPTPPHLVAWFTTNRPANHWD